MKDVLSYNFKTYLSPFTWRYGSEEMRYVFSEEHKYEIWRKIWVAIAEAQHAQGLIDEKELADLKKQQNNINIERILKIEKETHHDVVAAIKEFAEKAKVGGGKIHLGATSMDIVDNADMLRMQEGLGIIEKKVRDILKLFAKHIEKYADLPCMGYTHLQPAEPTTVGYRLSFYAQDLLTDVALLDFVKKTIAAKGMKGAVGTAASYKMLHKDVEKFEATVMQQLGLRASLISTQVYSRKFDYLVLTVLASIASSLAKFAGDLRIMQSAQFGEWSEPFGEKQVGSSAMPFKKNPITAENICSLARFVTQLPPIALENASLSYFERTLDDSANKRLIIAEGFLAVDEILEKSEKIIRRPVIHKEKIAFNLGQYAPFAATEKLLIEAVKKGADRQNIHELLRTISMEAWKEVQAGKPNPIKQLLTKNKKLARFIKKDDIKKALDIADHIGNAPERARKLIQLVQRINP